MVRKCCKPGPYYVGLGKYCELPHYGRCSDMEDNDRYIQLSQKDAVKILKEWIYIH